MSEMIKIPEGWETAEISKIATQIKSGGTPKSDNKSFYNGDIKFTTIEDITASNKYLYTTKKTITELGFNNSNTWLVGKDNLLYSIYATLGVPIITKTEVTTNQAILGIELNNNVDLEFIYYRLVYDKEQILSNATQTTQSNLNATIVKNTLLILPKLKQEQQKIAEVLSEIDNAISKAEELFEKNKRLKTALMQDLLSYGVDEKGKIRNPQTHTFKPSEIGDIPEEWACIPFTEFLNVIDGDRGDNYPTEADFYKDEFCLFLNAKNVTKNGFNFEEKSFITKEKDAKLSKGKLEKNDLILTTRGTVGNVAYFDKTVKTTHMRINSGMVILRIFSSHLHHQYFYEFLKSYIFEKQKNNVIFGSAQPQLTVAQIKKFYCNFPKSKTEQQKIAQILSSQDEKIEDIKNKLNKLKSLKTSLMQDLLSGKVRVTKLMEENS